MSNQVDQIYVYSGTNAIDAVKTTAKGEVYFTYQGPGGILRSDLIKPDQVMSYTKTLAPSQRQYLKDAIVHLDATKLVVGENYQVKIVISQFQDMAEDSLYYKYGVAHCGNNDTVHTMLEKLVKSLCRNFSREITTYFEFGLTDGSNTDWFDKQGKVIGGTATVTAATDLIIREVAQDWHLGLMPKQGVNFSVYVNEVIINGVEEKWGTVTVTNSPNFIGNGYTLADMEYFYMGDRGDQYRMFAAPQDRIPTKLLIDPTQEYDVINIHYYFVDSLGGVQKSEKDIMIVLPTGSSPMVTYSGSSATLDNALVAALGI
jgi:hypothetical protein